MKTLKDSSEIRESARLFDELLSQSAVVVPARPRTPVTYYQRAMAAPPMAATPPRPEPAAPEITLSDDDAMYRGDRLENALFAMCKRGGFVGAVLVDNDGLPLAIYNSPVAEQILAGVTVVLGEAMEKIEKLLDETHVNNISLDTNYSDKAVIRRFFIMDQPYFLLTICPQDIDERAEVELSIENITTIVKKK